MKIDLSSGLMSDYIARRLSVIMLEEGLAAESCVNDLPGAIFPGSLHYTVLTDASGNAR